MVESGGDLVCSLRRVETGLDFIFKARLTLVEGILRLEKECARSYFWQGQAL